jgi:hypothetical protein
MSLTLVILAGGRSQRFGRSKQIEPVGPAQEAGTYPTPFIAWQVTGVILIESCHRAPGPSASLTVVVLTVAIAIGLVVGLRYFKPIFVALCALLVWGGCSTIRNAFTVDPSLWPSDWTRYLGILINAIGVAGASLGIVSVLINEVNVRK